MKQSHYEVLELKTDATPQEVREAYLRIKHAFSKDSLATYSLISREEGEALLQRIEEAYAVLSHTERRRAYDREWHETRALGGAEAQGQSFTDSVAVEDLLIAPPTEDPFAAPQQVATPRREAVGMEVEILSSIAKETEWRGTFLQAVRKSRNISIEELSEFAKVSKTYLRAIEDEDFKKLPAIVFVRGFLVQICKKLKLPEDQVVPAYLARVQKAKQSG